MRGMYRLMLMMIVGALALAGVWGAGAQDATPTPGPMDGVTPTPTLDPNRYLLTVFADSAFLRLAPDFDAQRVSSVFEDETLVAVGRNIDGTWFQARRPGGAQPAGWISREVVLYSFTVADLPITDLTTGVTGPDAVYDSGLSTFILLEATLRARPSTESAELAILPIQLTLPLLDRTLDNQWLRVNYRGTVGWVAEFLTRPSVAFTDIPVNPEFQVGFLAVEVIPLEVQLDQIASFRDYVTPILDLSDGLANFWALVRSGETVPCNPPGGGFAFYPTTPRDIVELPELRDQERNVRRAVSDLNASIEAMQRCGVYTADAASEAYADAINARAIARVVLANMNNLEARLLSR